MKLYDLVKSECKRTGHSMKELADEVGIAPHTFQQWKKKDPLTWIITQTIFRQFKKWDEENHRTDAERRRLIEEFENQNKTNE